MAFRYVEDLAAVTAHLGLTNAIHIGHSTGGGEVARYVARYQDRVAKAVLIGAVPPIMVKSDRNPGGMPISVFDEFRERTAGNRAQFFLDSVLRIQSSRREGLARRHQQLVASRHDGRRECTLRLHQGLLGN